jgi:hypothetical protein
MPDWLVETVSVFGLPAQNWMLVVAGGLALYLVTLALVRRCQTHSR